MATHDYVIDNSTGANVRADINSVLQAILSNNSSSSAPSTTAAYMWWADTTNGILKIRNSANNAWVELLQLDGTLTLEDGSASTPALAFRDDLDTGIFSAAANHFNIATAGVERVEFQTTEVVFNDTGVDCDFRIEGDNNANCLKLDAGNDRVGIGLASPITPLHVYHATTNGVATFESGDATCLINFQDNSTTSSPSIGVVGNDLNLVTADSNRLTILNGGNVGIGTTSPGLPLHVKHSTSNGVLKVESGDSNCGITIADNSGEVSVRAIGNDLTFNTSSSETERMRINSSGSLFHGCTSSPDSSDPGSAFIADSNQGQVRVATNSSATAVLVDFYNAHGNVGSIRTSSNNTSYNTSSDYRLKENAVAISDAITRLKTLKPYRFNFKVDPTKTVDGFFAHEVTAVPEAITGTKDEIATEDNDLFAIKKDDPIYQGIDQSKLVPLLTAALQEAVAKIETLETKVAALEAA